MRNSRKRYLSGLFFSILFVLQSCNYNYYRGKQLEKEERYEEANIEFHRAFTSSPNNEKFKEAYERTAELTVIDLLERYEKYRDNKQYLMAFRRLERANTLAPNHQKVRDELKKWYRILLAGKVDLVKIRSLQNQIPLSDKIVLEIRFNTPNVTKRLEAAIDYQTKIFAVEDILYDPPQNILMLYSVNSIGVKLENSRTRRSQFKKFIDFKVPVLVDVQGELSFKEPELKPVSAFYPFGLLSAAKNDQFLHPRSQARYSLNLKSDRITINSATKQTAFLPQILYINKEDRRYFLDFGHLQLAQKRAGGLWTIRRNITEGREYLAELNKNLILNPYFYFREGGYPYVKQEG